MATRRIGAESSDTRARIVASAEAVIRDEGYAAASTRRVAAHAGLKPSLVHYYFPTTDDLLLAVFRRGAEHNDSLVEQALAGDDPVRGLWRFFADAARTSLAHEFLALAVHHEPIRAEIARRSEEARARQAALIERLLGERLRAQGCEPAGFALVLAGIARALVLEDGLGVAGGHDEARAWVERWLDRLLETGVVDPQQA